MKKLVTLVSSLFLVSIISAKAEVGMGVSGALHMLKADGSETTRTSGEVNNGSHDEDAYVPEIFVEIVNDNGGAFGVSYIPVRDMGSKSRTDSNSEGDSGTYKAAAELDNVLKLYGDIPLGSVGNSTSYLTVGLQHVEVVGR